MYPRQYFDLFNPNYENDMVFVGMSFAATEETKWLEIIAPAIRDAGFKPFRVDMSTASDSILFEIMHGIFHARLLLLDISVDDRGHRNENVMYEMGLAHAIRHAEEVLIIRSDTKRLLFDVSNIRVHTYNVDDKKESRASIARLLRQLADGQITLKSFVLDRAISMLDEVCLGFMESHARQKVFHLKAPEKAFDPEVVAARTAIRHMLELGLLKMHWRREERFYGFVWTHLGRAALHQLGFDKPLHLVSAWATQQGMTLGQVAVDTKSNEITAIPKLLEMLELKGAIISIDAMGCQKEIAKKIVNGGGDYLLAVKDNQSTLHKAIRMEWHCRDRVGAQFVC